MMPTVTLSTSEPTSAARAGTDLRQARERLGLALEDVAAALNIRLPYLQALEEGRISSLPGGAYTLAFVRAYAAALGLDPRAMVRRFQTEATALAGRAKLVFPVPMPDRGLPAGAVVLLGVVMTIGAYAGWYRLSGEGRLPAETVTAIPEHLASLAEQASSSASGRPMNAGPPTPPAPDVHQAGHSPTAVVADTMSLTLPANLAPPVMAISPSSAAAAQLNGLAVDAVAGIGQSLPASTGSSANPSGDQDHIVIRAGADAWVVVRDHTGSVLLNRTMKAGESWSWPLPSRADLILTTKAAGGTDGQSDKVTVPGTSGTVQRDISPDSHPMKDRRPISALAPRPPRTHP